MQRERVIDMTNAADESRGGLKVGHDIYHVEIVDYLDSGNLREVMTQKSDFNGQRENGGGKRNTEHMELWRNFSKRGHKGIEQ